MSGASERFLVYSLAKTFLAVLCLRLEFDLETRAQTWVAEPRLGDATLRQLLRHTAGVPDYGRLPEYHAAVRERPGEPWSDEELLARVLSGGPDFAPGAGWAYSNTGYLLVRLLLELHGDLGDLLERELLSPLGLRDTALALEPLPGGYDPRWVGHRTLWSTVADQTRFWSALARGELCDLSVLADAVPVGVDAPGFGRPGYGLGVMTDLDREDGLLLGHGGGGPGYAAGAFALVRAGRDPLVAVVLRADGADAQGEALALLQSDPARVG